MKYWWFILMFLPVFAFGITADEIIRRVDLNEVMNTQYFECTMRIKKGSKVLEKKFFGYGKKTGSQSYMEFTNPEDKGVKYLKKENEMWIYFPDADDVMKISGHMLRKGMMGSDISYEDMLENDELEKKYQSTLLSQSTNIEGHSCYILELVAKVPDVSYYKEVVFVDKELYVIRLVDMYAKGNRLIKQMSQHDFVPIGARHFPKKAAIRDMRKANSETEIEFTTIKLDIAVPAEVFTMTYLKR